MHNSEISKCEFYSADEQGIGRCFCNRSDGQDVELTACYSCTDNPDCYYKQLQQLKKENESLKENLRDTQQKYSNQYQINENKGYLKAERKLEKIKDVIINFSKTDVVTLPDLKQEHNYKMIAKQYAQPIKEILQIIGAINE